jgi:hypothetical protein
MAFKKVESSSSGSIPFFDVWAKEQSEEYQEFLIEKVIEPKHIKQVQSGKGFLLNFDDEFMVFIWKASSIGKVIKRMIADECGNMILLQFQKSKKGLTFEIGFDDEIEVALTEDKYDEGIYFCEATTEIPSIAPNENRKYLSSIPLMETIPPARISASKVTTPKSKQRSDGESGK